MDIHDYIEHKKKLQNYSKIEKSELLKILEKLERSDITAEILMQSQIHAILSKLAKNKKSIVDEDISEKAKEVRKEWKKKLQNQKSVKSEKKEETKNEFRETKKLFKNTEIEEKKKEEKIEQTLDVFFEDKNREKFFYNIYNKIKSKTNGNDEQIKALCLEIEKTLYRKSVDEKIPYIKVVRERWLILNDKECEELPFKLLYEDITPNDFCFKQAKELLKSSNFDQLKKDARNYTIQALQTDFYLKNTDFKEGEFQCYRCKGKKIVIEQKQMRSADEPMTCFFTCVDCNNRWKM
jgi:transcription elongation factor S-II